MPDLRLIAQRGARRCKADVMRSYSIDKNISTKNGGGRIVLEQSFANMEILNARFYEREGKRI